MESLSSSDVTVMFLSIGVLLGAARLLGELARRFHQPAVLGEMLAGILLGPTGLGAISPRINALLFPTVGKNAVILNGLTTLAVALFLLVAGMELDLSTVWRQGRTALSVAAAGIVAPFTLGFFAASVAPLALGGEPGADRLIFALFIATALSISALPVIARTLIDLNIYRSDLGMVIVAAAILNDLVGWIIFAIILGLLGSPHHGVATGLPPGGPPGGLRPDIGLTIALTIGYAAFMLTAGRWLIHRVLPWLQAYTSWPGGVLGFALTLALLGAAFTEWIGVHAIFGAFLVGVAIGDSAHLREQTRTTIQQFVSFIFAPLFFASIGLRVNFIAHFDGQLALIVLVIACLGKIAGCGLGARLSGMPPREAWATGFGMNARGAMEIILGLLALQYGLISPRLFVALVIMALITSMISGPAIQRLLRSKKPRHLAQFLTAKTFLHPLQATGRREAVQEMAGLLATATGLEATHVDAAIWNRECLMPTGMARGLAVPHARIEGLGAPVVGVALSEGGVDFDSPDGDPARIICMILTPVHDNGAQLEILADIARTFRDHELNKKVLAVANYTQFLALLKSEANGGTEH